MAFRLLRPLLHTLPPECAHNLGIAALRYGLLPPAKFPDMPSLATQAWGLSFKHPLGLAAGFDKNAAAPAALLAQGFAFVEAGTVTPKPQPGNPKPRIFRLKEDEAVINRLGFNNGGLELFIARLRSLSGGGIVGANIGKNKDTDDAAADYIAGLEAVYPYASYITVNISSPNTQGLRALQQREALSHLLSALQAKREALHQGGAKRIPLLLKVAPDLSPSEAEAVAACVLDAQIDGLIVSNTTLSRPESLRSPHASQQGGLSGRPLMPLSTEQLALFHRLTQGKLLLVGVGGIASGADAYAKIRAGATLVQLYSALVYQGFGVIRRVCTELEALLARDGFAHVSEAVGVDAKIATG